MLPGFDDPAVASIPNAQPLYFASDQALAAKSPGEVFAGTRGNQGSAHHGNPAPAPLMFGEGAINPAGEHIITPARATRGHWSEVLNFHGSPAPWVLIGILLVAGVLHLQAAGRLGFGGRV